MIGLTIRLGEISAARLRVRRSACATAPDPRSPPPRPGDALGNGDDDGRLDLGCVAAHGFFHFDQQAGRYEIIAGGKPATAFLFKLISFRYPSLQWPGTFRPFEDYDTHLDLIALYTFNEDSLSRIDDIELIVHEAWRIASKDRSSTTREYLGAVTSIEDLRAGRGEFKAEKEFYTYWRKFPFKIGKAVQQQLDKLLAKPGKRRGKR